MNREPQGVSTRAVLGLPEHRGSAFFLFFVILSYSGTGLCSQGAHTAPAVCFRSQPLAGCPGWSWLGILCPALRLQECRRGPELRRVPSRPGESSLGGDGADFCGRSPLRAAAGALGLCPLRVHRAEATAHPHSALPSPAERPGKSGSHVRPAGAAPAGCLNRQAVAAPGGSEAICQVT